MPITIGADCLDGFGSVKCKSVSYLHKLSRSKETALQVALRGNVIKALCLLVAGSLHLDKKMPVIVSSWLRFTYPPLNVQLFLRFQLMA